MVQLSHEKRHRWRPTERYVLLYWLFHLPSSLTAAVRERDTRRRNTLVSSPIANASPHQRSSYIILHDGDMPALLVVETTDLSQYTLSFLLVFCSACLSCQSSPAEHSLPPSGTLFCSAPVLPTPYLPLYASSSARRMIEKCPSYAVTIPLGGDDMRSPSEKPHKRALVLIPFQHSTVMSRRRLRMWPPLSSALMPMTPFPWCQLGAYPVHLDPRGARLSLSS